MATRADDLEPTAIDVAKKLAARYGGLKHVLSAGILTLDWLSSGYRDMFLDKAAGQPVEIPPAPEERPGPLAPRDFAARVVRGAEARAAKLRGKKTANG